MRKSFLLGASLLALALVTGPLSSAYAKGQKKKAKKPVAAEKKKKEAPKADTKAVTELMGPFKWGMTPDEVFAVLGKQIALLSQPRPVRTIVKDGRWTLDELDEIVPRTLAQGLANPAPVKPAGEPAAAKATSAAAPR